MRQMVGRVPPVASMQSIYPIYHVHVIGPPPSRNTMKETTNPLPNFAPDASMYT